MSGSGTEGPPSPAYGRQVTSSRLEPPTHTTGAHRSHRRAPQLPAQRPPARYEPYLDGLFTYCLSVLCDHEAATEALGAVLAVAERRDGRCPTGQEERKSWLYALARWMCLRVLAEQKRGRQAHRRTPRGARRREHEEQDRAPADVRTPAPPASPTASGAGTFSVPVTRAAPPASPLAVRPAPLARPALPVRPPALPALPVRPPALPVRPVPARPAAQGAEKARGRASGAARTPGTTPGGAVVPQPGESAASEARRRELAQLAWPEAAGTTPEQREALELSVRHGLTPRAVASVLGLDPATARELLAAAACEVERTRAALAVAEDGTCSAATRLTGNRPALLSAPLRRELVRHVDDCPRCRRAAERAGATAPWPGAAVAPAAGLPVVEAPRPSVRVAMVHAQRSRAGFPRFDRTGYPLDPKDHAARRDRLRARVMTTTVVATVVAAPVIALWAAYRGAPPNGDGQQGASAAATEMDEVGDTAGALADRYDGYGRHDGGYRNTGDTHPGARSGATDGPSAPDVTAEVISAGAGAHGAGALAVATRTSGGVTALRLTASAGGPVVWTARADARWLRLTRGSGTLAAGQSVTVHVLVDRVREPRHAWRARIVLAPGASDVRIEGRGRTPVTFPAFPPGGPARPAMPPAAPPAPVAAARTGGHGGAGGAHGSGGSGTSTAPTPVAEALAGPAPGPADTAGPPTSPEPAGRPDPAPPAATPSTPAAPAPTG